MGDLVVVGHSVLTECIMVVAEPLTSDYTMISVQTIVTAVVV